MAKIGDMDGDVYFGMTENLPDWRKEPLNEHEDATEEEKAAVVAVLGFDPRDGE